MHIAHDVVQPNIRRTFGTSMRVLGASGLIMEKQLFWAENCDKDIKISDKLKSYSNADCRNPKTSIYFRKNVAAKSESWWATLYSSNLAEPLQTCIIKF